MEALQNKLDEICKRVNLNETTKNEAWKRFSAAAEQFVLEGDQVSWLVCSLYATCCLEEIETMDGNTSLGNFISLANVLQVAGISLYNFFSRLHQWCEMVAAPTGFSAHIHRLEQRFIVSSVVFSKYRDTFIYVFGNPDMDGNECGNESEVSNKHGSPPTKKTRKVKNAGWSNAELFDFGWTVFLLVKTQYRQISDNLLNCYHLAQACIDWLYSSCVLAGRDISTPAFKEDFAKTATPVSSKATIKVPSIIHLLCKKFSGVEVESLAIRQYHWQPALNRFLESGVLKLNGHDSVLDPSVFTENFSKASEHYDAFIKKTGDFDERVLLSPDAHARIGSPPRSNGASNILSPLMSGVGHSSELMPPPQPLVGSNLGAARKLLPVFGKPTPLTAREQLSSSFAPSTPIYTAATTAACIAQLASCRPPGISDVLQQMLDKTGVNYSETFESMVKEYENMLHSNVMAATKTGDAEPAQVAAIQRITKMSTSLFYRCSELLLAKERHIMILKTGNNDVDIGIVATQPSFLRALYALCCEIILSAFLPGCTFPWSLSAFGLEAHDLLKVIEPLVRADDHLPREIVKHLNFIEESILENYLWTSNSSFWRLLENCEIPGYEEVCLEKDHQLTNQMQPSPSSATSTPMRASSLTPGMSRVMSSPAGNGSNTVPASPVASSSVCRALFAGEDDSKAEKLQSVRSVSIGSSSKIAPDLSVSLQPKQQTLKRSGSVALIFRKLYRLIALRLNELCNSLGMGNRFLQQTFTFVEHCLTNDIKILKDRHVDQIILCSIYMLSKVLQKPMVSFSEMLRWYRKLPHANSATYRDVLIGQSNEADSSSTSKKEHKPSGKSVNLSAELSPDHKGSEVSSGNRGDIVHFYNKVFLPIFQDFAVELGEGRKVGSVIPSKFNKSQLIYEMKFFNYFFLANSKFAKLSPLPCRRTNGHGQMLSPRHLSSQVTVQPMETSPARLLSANAERLVVQVSSSPSNDLQNINSALRHRATMSATRRLLGDIEASSQSSASNATSSSTRQLLDSLGA